MDGSIHGILLVDFDIYNAFKSPPFQQILL